MKSHVCRVLPGPKLSWQFVCTRHESWDWRSGLFYSRSKKMELSTFLWTCYIDGVLWPPAISPTTTSRVGSKHSLDRSSASQYIRVFWAYVTDLLGTQVLMLPTSYHSKKTTDLGYGVPTIICWADGRSTVGTDQFYWTIRASACSIGQLLLLFQKRTKLTVHARKL